MRVILLVLAIVAFSLAGLSAVNGNVNLNEPAFVAFGLAFFAGSFLPVDR